MLVVRNAVASVTNFSLTPIPFFLLMGEVLFHTGLAMKAIDAFDRAIRHMPARLSVIAVVAGTVFSAISGSTIGTTALLGSLLLPQMLSRGYHPTPGDGADHGDRCGRHADSPVGADGPARQPRRHFDLRPADCRRRARAAAVDHLRRLHHAARVAESRARSFGRRRGIPRLAALEAAGGERDAAGADLRAGGGRHVGRVGHAHRVGSARRGGHHRDLRALPKPEHQEPGKGIDRHRSDHLHHPVHHHRCHHLLPDPGVLGRDRRAGVAGTGRPASPRGRCWPP